MFELSKYRLKFNCLFEKINCKSKDNLYPQLKKIDFFSWGFRAYVDIAGICSFNDINTENDFIKNYFRADYVEIINYLGFAILEVYTIGFKENEYKKIDLTPYQLLAGYNLKDEPIIIDNKITPHVAIQGLSNAGKTKCIELMIRNLKGASYYLLNTFEDDFEGYSNKINGLENINQFLDKINKRQLMPTYIFIDEIVILNRNKEIAKKIENLLCVARHLNIYLVCVGQILLKEFCSYKQLFNTRISFKVADINILNSFMNLNLEDKDLEQREFFIYSDKVEKGKTYIIPSH